MKNLNLICFCLFFSFTSLQGQFSTNAEIIGNWSVVKVDYEQELSKKQKRMWESLRSAFSNSEFRFVSDKKFNFVMDFEDFEIIDAHWKYNAESKSLIIQKWKDKDKDKESNWKKKDSENPFLMEIVVKQENGKVLFSLAETPFILVVEKDK